jgi:LAO/AO transport system kinase
MSDETLRELPPSTLPEPPRPPRRVRRLSVPQYVEGVLAKDRGTLSRVITLIESRRADDRALAREVLTALLPETGRSIRLGITGVPGAGKSTLIERLGLNLTSAGHRVAVLAIDPSSRISGGSILGDKTRMTHLSLDENAYIRPSPSGMTLGGVARTTREAMLVCEAAGFDVVIVETVGVGQSETTVSDMVDFFLAILISGAGDELQGIKRGILEMTDMIAVNKADGDNRTRAQRAIVQYQNAMRLIHPAGSLWVPPVVACSAIENEGLDRIWQLLNEHRQKLLTAGVLQVRRREQSVRWMWDLVNEAIQRHLHDSPALRDLTSHLADEVEAGRSTAAGAADTIIDALGLKDPEPELSRP